MAWVSLKDFAINALPAEVFQKYKNDNTWYTWGDNFGHLRDAYYLYKSAQSPSTGMLLLGETKIRSCPNLVFNFGLAGKGPDDPKEKQLIDEIQKKRADLWESPRPLTASPPVVTGGAILSDSRWSKIMNDCYIVAGLHNGLEFHLAEDSVATASDKKSKFEAKPAGPVVRPPNPLDLPLSEVQLRWKNFFNFIAPDMFWRAQGNCPRVFARELVGLMTFGYAPYFFTTQLSFKKAAAVTGVSPQNADLRTYLRALDDSGYNSGAPDILIKKLSTYLFGTEDALKVPLSPVR